MKINSLTPSAPISPVKRIETRSRGVIAALALSGIALLVIATFVVPHNRRLASILTNVGASCFPTMIIVGGLGSFLVIRAKKREDQRVKSTIQMEGFDGFSVDDLEEDWKATKAEDAE